MKIGSLVECVNVDFSNVYGVTHLKANTPYTVRDLFVDRGVTIIRIEEIVNDICSCGCKLELGYLIERFREIEFPPLLEAEIQESLTRELQEVCTDKY